MLEFTGTGDGARLMVLVLHDDARLEAYLRDRIASRDVRRCQRHADKHGGNCHAIGS
jgi:hypothetical protein